MSHTLNGIDNWLLTPSQPWRLYQGDFERDMTIIGTRKLDESSPTLSQQKKGQKEQIERLVDRVCAWRYRTTKKKKNIQTTTRWSSHIHFCKVKVTWTLAYRCRKFNAYCVLSCREHSTLIFDSLFKKPKTNSDIIEGPKLINIIFMRVYYYVCVMHVLDTFPGSSWQLRIHGNV